LEVNGQPDAPTGIGPAAPPLAAELVASLAQLVGSPAEVVGSPDQLPGSVAPLAGQHSPSLPQLQLEERASTAAPLKQGGAGRNGYTHCETNDQFFYVHDNFEENFIDTDNALPFDFENNIAELEDDLYESAEEDGDDDGSHVDVTSTKYLFRDSTWKKEHVTYDPKPMEFTGVHGNNFFWNTFPTML
jgi:hypothetical protein